MGVGQIGRERGDVNQGGTSRPPAGAKGGSCTNQEVAQDTGRAPDKTVRPALDLALLLMKDLKVRMNQKVSSRCTSKAEDEAEQLRRW